MGFFPGTQNHYVACWNCIYSAIFDSEHALKFLQKRLWWSAKIANITTSFFFITKCLIKL